MSVKQTKKCWDLVRKRFRDVQKRESDFTTAARQEISTDFCVNQNKLFRERLRQYERTLEAQFDKC